MEIFKLFGTLSLRGGSEVSKQINGIGKSLTNVGSKMMSFGAGLTAGVTLPLIAAIGKSTMLASDLEESANVVNVTFGKSADEVKSWSKTLLNSYGLVELETMQMVGSMGAMLKSSGLTSEASLKMSKDLVTLTGDMSSFYNLKHEETWEKIRSGISGETEPLKELGINMSVANMEAYALSRGIKKSWSEMDQGEQTILRYDYLMKVTSDSQGDFARTSDGLANQIRILKGNLTDIGSSIGKFVLPWANKLTTAIVDITTMFKKLPDSIKKAGGGITGFLIILGPLIAVIGSLAVAIGTIAGAITLISTPILVAGAAIAIITTEILGFGTAITFVGLKTGILQKVFFNIKIIIQSIIEIFKGDFSSAMDLLTTKLGMSKEQASEFIGKFVALKLRISQAIEVVKDITKLLGMIFTGDSQEMVDLLMKKFGLSALEAVKFKAQAEKLRKKIIELMERFKDTAIEGVKFMADKLKEGAKWIYDHREEIVNLIDTLVKFGITAVDNINKVMDVLEDLKPVFKEVFDFAIDKVGVLADGLLGLVDVAGKVFNKINNIDFNFSSTPKFATGVRNFSGGMALVGEQGPELLYLPKGSNVYSNDETRKIIHGSSTGNTQPGNIYNNKSENKSIINIGTIQIDPKNIKDFNDLINIFKNINTDYITS